VFAPETSPIEALTKGSTVTAAAIHAVAAATMNGVNADDDDFTVYEHYVAAFGGNNRNNRPSRSALPSAPCDNAPCRGRSHPPDLCCICYAPHPWAKCWHLNGLPEREMTRCNEFKSAVARGDVPKPVLSQPSTGFKRNSSIQHPQGVAFADDAGPSPVDCDVEDVHRTMLLTEAGYGNSDYMLKPPESFVSSIIPQGHHFATPSDDPDDSLPAGSMPFLPDVPPTMTSAEPTLSPPSGHTWWHIDTGATDFCSNRSTDLLAPIPTNQPIGTAATGAASTIEATGMMTLSAMTANGAEFMQSIPQVFHVPSFAQRTFSPHGFRSLGYEAVHSVSNYLLLIHSASGTKFEFPVHTVNGNTDFVAFRINAIASLPPDLRVSAINLSSRLRGDALFYLLHFRFGCLSPVMLEILIKRGAIKGIPVGLRAPADFQCPICLMANAQRATSNPGVDHVISIKGSRFHADFFFPSVVSIRGYVAVLLIIEPVTSHGWVFLRRSKHPPIQLLVWFITHLRRRLQLSFSVLRTDGGGELYGSPALRSALAQLHCQTKTTDGYNASANGPPETAGGLIKRTMRCLLLMGGEQPNHWCFAVPFSQVLENVRPRRKYDYNSSHAGIYGKAPSYDHLRILFSMVYILVSRASCRHQDPLRRAMPGVFLGYQGTGRVLIYKDEASRIRYAHHAVIDELQSARDPAARSPAARILHNLNLDIPFRDNLTTAIDALEITPSRWSHAGLSTASLPSLGPNGELGLNLSYSATYCRCKIVSLRPDSPAAIHLQPRDVLNRYLLAINGATVRLTNDIQTTLASLHSIEIALDGIMLLLGSTSDDDATPEDANFVPADVNMQRAVWSIAHPSAPPLSCPKTFGQCMKGPFRREWLASLFKNLDSNDGYNAFAAPVVPPAGACVLDCIIALKHKTDEFNRLVERKLRLCAHGGQQIAGLDYDESYAPAIPMQISGGHSDQKGVLK
jgi:hypothetical protein